MINGRGYVTISNTVWSCGSISLGRGCSAVVHAQTEKLSYIHSMYLHVCVICTCVTASASRDACIHVHKG